MKYVATAEDNAKRLDIVAAAQLPQLSRSSVRKLIDEQRVTVNGQAAKASHKLNSSDRILIDFDLKELDEIQAIDLPILYEDEDCLVISKPIGILTHSKGAFNPEATVATFIKPMLQGLDGDRGGIVHRLDRATSGVIICTKTPEALAALQRQFSQRNVKKTYYAIVEGEVEPSQAVIEVPIERNPRDPKTFRPGVAGKPAVTEYKVVATGNGYSLLKLQPQTGRTHQLRVHLKYIGHPIVGDSIYSGNPHKRLFLHAQQLEITLPNRQRKVFTVPIPTEFQAILKT